MFLWLTTVFYFLTILGSTRATCDFTLDSSLNGKSPFVLVDDKALNPQDRTGSVSLKEGFLIKLLCSGQNNYLINQRIGSLVNATCTKGKFILEASPPGTSYDFNDLVCRKLPQSQTREVGTCNLNSKRIEIGFVISPWKFLSRIELCFDPNILTTYWSKHYLQTSDYSCQRSDTTTFKKDFFNVDVNGAYESKIQFDRGHLTPKCDFFTGVEKRMTFYYVNAAPQYAVFNRNNWKALETEIRNFGRNSLKEFYIYTGITNFASYLITKNKIAVPKYFWKVVIDPTNGKGVAFIGVNSITQDFGNLCAQDKCNLLTWLGTTFTINRQIIAKGKIYCCDVDSFQSVANLQIPNFPEYRNGLLTN